MKYIITLLAIVGVISITAVASAHLSTSAGINTQPSIDGFPYIIPSTNMTVYKVSDATTGAICYVVPGTYTNSISCIK